MAMNRRFVHLVASTIVSGRPAYKLHLIDPSTFFHSRKPSGAVPTVDGTPMEEFAPPPAAVTFFGPCSELEDMDFMSFGRGSEKSIVAVDCEGNAALYSPSPQILTTVPPLHSPKVEPISLPVGDSLYIMNRKSRSINRRNCFEALIRGRGSGPQCKLSWHWRSLPPPPYVRGSNSWQDNCFEDDDINCFEDDDSDIDGEPMFEGELTDITGHTVVGDSQIWISTAGAGTYTFDTGSVMWGRRLDWQLPFRGRAEYVPEHNLWFGFSSHNNLLCAADLTATSEENPPVLKDQWEDVVQAEGWKPVASYLLPLGCGKFFLAKFFNTKEKQFFKDGGWDDYGISDNFAVFAGVEVLDKDGGGLSMIKHLSKRYTHVHPDLVI